ncbi:hypothetical protein TNCV_1329481 [Trichonephila clavipes]|nr:hypothetical protein TNCV_1329481 [Trichonephila clavipes]
MTLVKNKKPDIGSVIASNYRIRAGCTKTSTQNSASRKAVHLSSRGNSPNEPGVAFTHAKYFRSVQRCHLDFRTGSRGSLAPLGYCNPQATEGKKNDSGFEIVFKNLKI